jgi:MFS family permease
MSRRALAILGIGQCVNWGVLYYAFAVLLLPVERELGVARWVVTGAFSLALLMSAAFAPVVGRWADAGHGSRAIQTGGFAAAAVLGLWALLPGLVSLYIAWLALGLCMAACLYEPAFVVVGHAHADARQRLRALAAITVFGGLASTVFLPTTGWLVQAVGWRRAVLVLAGLVALSTCLTRVMTFNTMTSGISSRPPRAHNAASPRPRHAPAFWIVFAVFCLATLGSAALMSNLVPALGERSITPTIAASLGGLLGVMQVPGRAMLMHPAVSATPSRLIAVSLLLQALGALALATAPSVVVVGVAIAIFATGAGLTTLARPHFVQAVFGADGAGAVNGELARAQQLARAVGPSLAAWIAASSSYAVVFVGLGVGLACLTLAWMVVPQRLSMATGRT